MYLITVRRCFQSLQIITACIGACIITWARNCCGCAESCAIRVSALKVYRLRSYFFPRARASPVNEDREEVDFGYKHWVVLWLITSAIVRLVHWLTNGHDYCYKGVRTCRGFSRGAWSDGASCKILLRIFLQPWQEIRQGIGIRILMCSFMLWANGKRWVFQGRNQNFSLALFINIREFKKLLRRHRRQRRLKNEFIFHLQISKYS